MKQIVITDDQIITATYVFTKDDKLHFHVVSFIRVAGGKIVSIDEYWGDDGPPPQWRQDMRIGTKIKD